MPSRTKTASARVNICFIVIFQTCQHATHYRRPLPRNTIGAVAPRHVIYVMPPRDARQISPATRRDTARCHARDDAYAQCSRVDATRELCGDYSIIKRRARSAYDVHRLPRHYDEPRRVSNILLAISRDCFHYAADYLHDARLSPPDIDNIAARCLRYSRVDARHLMPRMTPRHKDAATTMPPLMPSATSHANIKTCFESFTRNIRDYLRNDIFAMMPKMAADGTTFGHHAMRRHA